MKKRKVIIDCDPGIDDSLAIMLALKSPEIEVIGITIVCGNSPVEMGFGNAKKILKQMNRLDVPVYIGESTPLRRDYVNALDTHGEDGLGESFLPEVTGYQQQISAVDFLADVLKKEKVSIIELAPMTNLARLIQKDKEAFSCIEEIVSMGGSFKSHGNCSPVAEYNYWCDPDGASLVYETLHQNGQKIHMVGLDVTRKIVLTPDLLEYMCRLNKETGEFVKKITKFYFDFHWEWEHIIGCVPPIFPINPLPAPNIRPKPTSQKTGVPIQKSIRFFIIMLPAFLARVKPVSTIANPACIKKTSAAPTSTHIVFTAENSIIIFLPHKNFLIFYKMQKARCLEM